MSRKDESTRDPSDTDLDDLQLRIDAQREAQQSKVKDAPPSAWSVGMRYGSEFFGGVLVGGGLGFMLDLVAPTSPWGLIVGTLFGFASGTLNCIRAARELNAEAETGNGGSSTGE